jgi:hypothetical protein
MPSHVDVDDLILNFDPAAPQERFRATQVEAALHAAGAGLPSLVPWPSDAKPAGVPLRHDPASSDDLSRFRGYEAVVVTWTAAEAAALAALFTPGHPPSSWYPYRYDVASYVPLVTGARAPFNDNQQDMARYYRTLGLYFPCQIGKARVLLFKSGLHLDYDGPATPVRRLMIEIARAVQPKVFITTGTGGGIGKDVALGDVVIAGLTRFDCTTQFKSTPWQGASYQTSALPAGTLDAIAPALTKVNASRIPGARAAPKVWASRDDAIVTTDFFGFDDSTNHYKLQTPGSRACDMGDAMVGNAMREAAGVSWYAIRNASDPQMPNGAGDIEAAKQQAGQIYAKYGGFTTAASVIATWAVIDCTFRRRSPAGDSPRT